MSANAIKSAKETMEKAIQHLQKELRQISAGRASPALLDPVMVAAYGAQTPLKDLCTISVPEARQLLIKPYDASLLKEIEKSILATPKLDMTPQNDGKVIRINFQAPTGERREKLAQDVKAKGEEAKVALRNIRRDVNKTLDDLKKKSSISEDEQKKRKEEAQTQLDEAVKRVDAEIAKKIAEIKEV